MLHDEASVFDAPESLSGGQAGEEFLFGAGQAECGCGGAELVGFLPVDDPRFGVGEQGGGEGAHRGALIANVVEVGEFVEDEHVRDPEVPGQSPLRVHAS